MIDDPILDEIDCIREQLLAENGGNLAYYIDGARRRTDEAALAGHPVVTLPPRPARTPNAPARKVG